MRRSVDHLPAHPSVALHLGVQLGTTNVEWSGIRDVAQRVEALGYDSVWVPDHLIAREKAAPCYEAWQVLSALALSTTRIRLGPLVSPVTFRHPAVMAATAATLDRISGGRVILGLGAGGMATEHQQYGLPFGTSRERGERLEEAVRIIRSLFDGPRTTFAGIHYRLDSATLAQKPVQSRLPVLVAGAGRRTMQVAARYADMWNVISLPAAFGQKLAIVQEDARDHDRQDQLLPTVSFRLIIRERTEQIAERLRQLDPVWREDPYRIAGSTDQVLHELREYVRLGAKGLIVQMPAPFDVGTLETLARSRPDILDHS